MSQSDTFHEAYTTGDRFRPTPRQKRLYDLLADIDRGLAEFYQGGVMILKDEDNPAHVFLAAHIARDIFEKLPWYIGIQERDLKDLERKQQLAKAIGASEDDPVTADWWDTRNALVGKAHFRKPGAPWPDASKCRSLFETFEGYLLRCFGPHYEVIEEIDELLAIHSPTRDEVDLLTGLLPSSRKRTYFFDGLSISAWLPLLDDHGFFNCPPHRGIWPESQCLARVAQDAPNIVFPIVKRLIEARKVSNGHILVDFIDAALAMPVGEAAEIAASIPNWLGGPQSSFVGFDIGALISKLAKGGRPQEALTLAKAVLELPHPSQSSTEQSNDEPAISLLIDAYGYQSILSENYPDVVRHCGMPALKLISDRLERALKIEGFGERVPYDQSVIWRPAIEDHQQNSDTLLKHHLVTAVRDAAKLIIELHPDQTTEICDHLNSRPFDVFQRIELHLLAEDPGIAPDRAAQRLCSPELFNNDYVRHEYYRLSQAFFGRLSQEEQHTIFTWIDAGYPDIEDWKAREEQKTGESPSADFIECRQAAWKIMQLRPLRNHLPADWRERYDQWVEEYGEPYHPEFPFFLTTSVGATSPISKDELLAMSQEQLLEFLATYTRDPNQLLGPSPEGLRSELTAAVKDNPTRFAEDAPSFMQLKPGYVRALLGGLENACTEKKTFNWESVLELCHDVATMPAPENKAVNDWDEDPDWTGCQSQLLTFLRAGFKEADTEIPVEYRHQVWQCIEPLIRHSQLISDDESRYGGLVTVAISSIRGQALETGLWYGVWCARHLSPDNHSRIEDSLLETALPELHDILEERLDFSVEPSAAVHSLFGMKLGLLVWLDRLWTEKSIGRIFPKDAEFQYKRKAAWNAYISFNHVHPYIAALLHDEYQHALSAVEENAAEKREPSETDSRLVQHIMVLYLHAEQELDGDLVPRIFHNLSGKLRAEAVHLLGTFFDHVGPAFLQAQEYQLKRVLALWEWRLEQFAEKNGSPTPDDMEELQAFGWVFSIHVLAPETSLNMMVRTLELTLGTTVPYTSIVGRLAELAEQYPLSVMNVLAILMKRDLNQEELWSVASKGRDLFTAVFASDEDEAKHIACRCINKLGDNGIDRFRDLHENYCKPVT